MRFGQYELGDLIARGGMAEVYAARRHGAEGFVKAVAIKRIREHISADPEFVRLFIAEARLVAQLRHANIVQIHDFDQVDGVYYLAMELVEGEDLRRVLQRAAQWGRRMSPELGLHVACEVAKGLMAAHDRCAADGRPLGIVHRDLSPHNVLLSYSGEVKVTDFGIAKAMNAASMNAADRDTGSDVVRGKLPYMAPEQVRGETVDQRTDLFALGLLLYELTTGRRRYDPGAREGLILQVSEAELPNPADHNAAISPELNALIRRLLARRPDDRYGSAREVLEALRAGGGVKDRSLELGAFMQALYPEEAEAARRGVGAQSSAERDSTARSGADRRGGGDVVTPGHAPGAGDEPGGSRMEPSGPTSLAAAMTGAKAGRPSWRPWIVGGSVALLGAVFLALWWLGGSTPRSLGGSDGHAGGTGGVEASGHRAIPEPRGEVPRPGASSPPAERLGGDTPFAAEDAAGWSASEEAAALAIDSEPSGAEVLVNGLPTGRRAPARLGVVPGRHRITVRWDDAVEVSEDRELRAGERLALRLRRPALRRVLGMSLSEAAMHEPRTGSETEARPVSRPSEDAPTSRPLVSPTHPRERAASGGAPSQVRFTCMPWAWVSIGGAQVGQTPLGRSLGPGRYSVTFRNPNLDQRRTIELRVRGDGAPERLDCQF